MIFTLILLIYTLFQMEKIIRDMQHADTGVPVRCQKIFLTTIPCAFTGNNDLFPVLIVSGCHRGLNMPAIFSPENQLSKCMLDFLRFTPVSTLFCFCDVINNLLSIEIYEFPVLIW